MEQTNKCLFTPRLLVHIYTLDVHTLRKIAKILHGQMGKLMRATSSRLTHAKQKLRSLRSKPKPTMPVYCVSKFTELFDGPNLSPDYPHGEFTVRFDVDRPFINPATATKKSCVALPTSKPEPNPESAKMKHEMLSAIKKLSSRSSRSRTPTPRSSAPITPTPGSHSPDTTPCLSPPSSVYSRATSASKPFTPLLKSPDPRPLGGYFVFNAPDGGFCDTRHLFENTAVPARILIAALAVLIEEADARDVHAVEEFRARLPRFGAWVKEKEGDERGERVEFGDGIAGGGWEEGVEWLRSHWVYEGHKRAVGAKVIRRINAAEKGVEIKVVGSSEDGTEVSDIGNENETGVLELPEIIPKKEDDGDEPEVLRGRSRTPRRATSAKRSLGVL